MPKFTTCAIHIAKKIVSSISDKKELATGMIYLHMQHKRRRLQKHLSKYAASVNIFTYQA